MPQYIAFLSDSQVLISSFYIMILDRLWKDSCDLYLRLHFLYIVLAFSIQNRVLLKINIPITIRNQSKNIEML